MTARYVAKVAAIAAAYYASGKLGLALAFATGSVTAVWPPTGIALAAVVLWGYRVWPGVALGAFLANSWTGVPVYAVAAISILPPRVRDLYGFPWHEAIDPPLRFGFFSLYRALNVLSPRRSSVDEALERWDPSVNSRRRGDRASRL